jgi:hypothetical protein
MIHGFRIVPQALHLRVHPQPRSIDRTHLHPARAPSSRYTHTTAQAGTNAGRSKRCPGCCRARAWDDEDRPLILKKVLKRKGRAGHGHGPYESTSLYTYIPDLFLFLFYFLMKEYYYPIF